MKWWHIGLGIIFCIFLFTLSAAIIGGKNTVYGIFIFFGIMISYLGYQHGYIDRQKKKAVKFYNEGLVLSESGDYEKALAAYNQALPFTDKNPNIWNNKCYVLTKLGRYDEAIDAGKVAVQLAPNDAEIRDTLQTALTAKGK